MTSVFQLYGRPLAENDALPPLRVEGELEQFEPGVAYEGRLEIIDNVGKCTVELLEGHLPPGWRLFVDNFNNQVVLQWDAYVPETETARTDVPNGDFEAGDDGSWNKGAGWSVEAGGAETGTYSGVFANQRGISSIESQRVPYSGETINASCRFQQGASSSGNLVGRILLIWCDANGKMLPGGEGLSWTGGTLIRSGSNGEWRTSSVAAANPLAETVAVGFSANRKKQNKLARVDNFVWNHAWRSGTNENTDYYIGLRVTDSANRTADWYGTLFFASNFFTSTLYPIMYRDDMELLPAVIHITPDYQYVDNGQVAVDLLAAELVSTVVYKTYTHSVPENAQVSVDLQGATLVVTTAYKTYTHSVPENAQVSTNLVAASLSAVAVIYDNWQTESASVSVNLVEATLDGA